MDHQEAIRTMAVERYLLNELAPEVREQFEAHFFDCPECAADLRATDAFLDAVKRESRVAPAARPAASTGKTRGAVLNWKPALAWLAIAACLLVIVYQNFLVYPRLTREIAQLKAPEILPSLSLVSGNSRGGDLRSIVVAKAQPFLVLVDIPTQDRFLSYTCSLYSPSGVLAWHVQVSAQEAKDTVSIRVPAVETVTGVYTLLVQGNPDRASAGPAVDLAHYRFSLNVQN
jgi:hypothetical protein